MRCPDCNKFVAQEPGDVDLEVTVQATSVDIAAHIVVNCAECGTELKTADLSGSVEVDEDIAQYLPVDQDDKPDFTKVDDLDLTIEDDSAEMIDEFQTTDRRGKRISNPRYQKHLYGATVTFTVVGKDQEGNEFRIEKSWEDKIEASAMDEV